MKCNKCNEPKTADDFNSRGNGQLKRICKTCERATSLAWRDRNFKSTKRPKVDSAGHSELYRNVLRMM